MILVLVLSAMAWPLGITSRPTLLLNHIEHPQISFAFYHQFMVMFGLFGKILCDYLDHGLIKVSTMFHSFLEMI